MPEPKPSFFQRVLASWAVRSLGVGALATSLDLALGTTLLALGVPTRFAAMSGTTLGATFGFFANRRFAFQDHAQSLGSSAVRYVLVVLGTSAVHGQVVVWFRDGLGLPYVAAKLLADLLVLLPSQLVLMRYLVFPRAKPQPSA